MTSWGSVPSGAVLPFFFDSFDGGTGASITLTGLAITDVEIYKGTSMTQRASDAGVVLLDTDGIDVDTITGIHGFSIDTGDNTDAGFYAVGSFFTVVVSAVTIDAQTVNFVAGTFRLLAAEAIAGKPKADVDAWLGTSAATPTVAGVPEVDVTHVAGATTDVSALATNVAAILVDTGTTLQAEVDAIQAAVITNAAGVDIAADIIALKAETVSILADTAVIGAAGAGLTAITGVALAASQHVIVDSGTVTTLTNLPAVAALEATLTAMKGATFAGATDSLEALRDRGDAAWITATGFATPTNITAGTIATVTNLTNLPAAGALEATLTAMKGATFAGATDSLEAIRDRGDAAWITATGFSTLVATDVVSAGAITTSAGKVSGVILTDTITTYTGDTKQTADVATLVTTVGAAGAGLSAIPIVPANVKKINDVTILGDGSITPFDV